MASTARICCTFMNPTSITCFKLSTFHTGRSDLDNQKQAETKSLFFPPFRLSKFSRRSLDYDTDQVLLVLLYDREGMYVK